MTKITVPSDCGNSPKKKLIIDFNRAFGEGDISTLAESLSEQVTWELIGKKTITGKEKVVEIMEEMKGVEVDEVIIHSIITHGKEAAANGVMVMKDGKHYAFADIYEFTSAAGNLFQKITSYAFKTN